MTDLSHSRRHAHRNTARTAAVRRLLSGKPKTTHLHDYDLFRKLMKAEAKLLKECWADVKSLKAGTLPNPYPDGYTLPVRWPGFTEWVRHL